MNISERKANVETFLQHPLESATISLLERLSVCIESDREPVSAAHDATKLLSEFIGLPNNDDKRRTFLITLAAGFPLKHECLIDILQTALSTLASLPPGKERQAVICSLRSALHSERTALLELFNSSPTGMLHLISMREALLDLISNTERGELQNLLVEFDEEFRTTLED